MNVLHAGWLALFLAAAPAPSPLPAPAPLPPTNPPAKSPQPATTPAPGTKTDEATDREYRALMEKDDAALEEVHRWIEEHDEAKSKGALISDTDLRLRVNARLEPVRQNYEEFLRRHPEHVNARIAYGSFLNDAGDDAGAIAQWERAREIDPNHPAVWNNAGNYYSRRGPIRKAFNYYAKAIELSPSQPIYYRNLAAAVFLHRQDAADHFGIAETQVLDRCQELYRKALKLDPTNFVLASDYAQSFYGSRPMRTQDALAAWESALKLAGDDIQRQGVRIHLARVEWMAGRTNEARQQLEQVRHPLLQELKASATRDPEPATPNSP